MGAQGRFEAGAAARVALIAGYLLMLAGNMPGHMSIDSVISLYEGRYGVSQSFNPPVYGWVLGLFDDVIAGTGLYVVVAALLLFGAWIGLTRLAPKPSWAGAVVAALIVLTPNVIIYQGIVWKDVFFANTATAAFVCLAYAQRDWTVVGRRLVWLTIAALLFALGAAVRQNGAVAPMLGALVVGLISNGALLRRVGWATGLAALVVVFGFGLSALAPKSTNISVGARIVQHYDMAGMIARDPTAPLPALHRFNPAGEAYLRARAPAAYSPERVDFLDVDPALGKVFWSTPKSAIQSDWLSLIANDPMGYARTKLSVFRWAFASPDIERCLPAFAGVVGPQAKLDRLKEIARVDRNDQRMLNYATWFYGTPVLSHLAYAVLSVVLMAGLLRRRQGADLAIAGLMGAGLAFAGSFLLISLACDYRYMYFLDIATMTGLLYVALYPRGMLGRRQG